MDAVPLWLIFLFAVALSLLSIEVGWRLGNRQRARAEMKDKTPVSAPVGAMMGLLAQSINEVIYLDTVRVTINRNRIPDSIWVMLAGVAMFSFAALGYEFGLVGARSWPLTILMTVTFISVIMLIADLDRAEAGLLQVSQQPLLDLLGKIGKP